MQEKSKRTTEIGDLQHNNNKSYSPDAQKFEDPNKTKRIETMKRRRYVTLLGDSHRLSQQGLLERFELNELKQTKV